MKKVLLCLLTAGLFSPAVAQEKFELGKPNDANYRYLDEYKALKEYIDKTKNPNFKLGAGTTVNDYLNNNTFKNLINKNFSETVAGNAMKMASCVNGNGNMNFETVKQYVKAATDAGLSVYGHTLAWHSQQPKAWLLSLIGDKPDPSSEETYQVVASKDFTKDQSVGWTSDKTQFGYTITFDSTDGMKIHTTKKCDNSWDVQFLAMENIPVEINKTYKMTMTVKGSADGKLHSKLGDWNNGEYPDIAFTTEWKDVEVEYKGVVEGSFFMLQCGDFVGDIFVKTIKFEGYKGKTIPRTKDEMHDALVDAMDKWIKGMMEACDGKVKGWDLVNEAIAGGGLDYIRQACRLARKYGPEDVKLFINDYNLEGVWDITTKDGISASKKVWSMVNWIKKWEADGVTKIDGIGTQMHISYYENSSSQENLKKAITGMFQVMANSGKLCRVSEMDMGYVPNGQNKGINTSQLTEDQHKKMADFYEWIIKEYLRIIPAAQQWSICQWCPTDAPDYSGWRGGEPVGIWDLDFYRKHVYAGFVRGLGGDGTTGISKVKADKTNEASKGIYTINGVRLNATSAEELPAGLYIIDGQKVVVK